MKKTHWNLRLQPKLLLGLVIMAAVLVTALTPAIAQLYRGHMEGYYSDLAFDQASIAARLIDGDSIEHYYRTLEKDEYYEEVRQYLQTVREEMGLEYFYVVVPEDEVMVYIWDAGVAGVDGTTRSTDIWPRPMWPFWTARARPLPWPAWTSPWI